MVFVFLLTVTSPPDELMQLRGIGFIVSVTQPTVLI